MSRLMGIDYGKKRVGVALTDEQGKMAFPYKVFPNNDDLCKNILAIISEKNISEIIVGHSLDKEGKPNSIQQQIESFMLDITLEVGLPVHLEPELYTTQAALRLQGRNDMTDAAAATLILDNYLLKKK